MNRPRNISKKHFILYISIISVIFYILLEFVCFLSLSPIEKKLPPSQLLKANQNQFIQEFALITGCNFSETVISHPSLGYVHRQPEYLSKRCNKSSKFNNIGLRSTKDLPLKKNPNEFAVLIVGGSVAEQFANYQKPKGNYYFEELLNKYIQIKNKKFRVYNGAIGGWSMPNQLHMLEMYSERIDGIVAIDGYNEATPIEKGERIEQIYPDLQIMANSRQNGFNQLYLKALWALQYGLTHKFIKHSYFFNVSYKIMLTIFQKNILSQKLLDEFSKGNREKILLPKDDAIQWSLDSLKRYNTMFHQLAQINSIQLSQFLQPTRLYGKTLTPEEKIAQEFVYQDIYRKIEKDYLELGKRYHVHSLTNIFEHENGIIYSDHIHFFRNKDSISKGDEIVAEEIARTIKKDWKF